jgi:hypothetical protein
VFLLPLGPPGDLSAHVSLIPKAIADDALGQQKYARRLFA